MASWFIIFRALLSSVAPFSLVRVMLYRILLGYSIDRSSKIGWLTIILVKRAKIRRSRLGRFNIIKVDRMILDNCEIRTRNRILNIRFLRVGKQAVIVRNNQILGTRTGSNLGCYSVFRLGNNSEITTGHFFDCTDSIFIGNNVTFGGIGSEFWTHGFNLSRTRKQGAIKIGSFCYFGSRCIVIDSVHIGDHCVISAGTVVMNSIPGRSISRGNPARIARMLTNSQDKDELQEQSRIPNRFLRRNKYRAFLIMNDE